MDSRKKACPNEQCKTYKKKNLILKSTIVQNVVQN